MPLDPFFGSVLAAGSNLLGGFLGSAGNRKANENARDAHLENLARQDEYAKRGITFRARDVMNAYKETGIHPLALMGVQGPTYSPTSPAFIGGSAVGEGIGRAGQDISRGIHATADRNLRAAALKVQEIGLQQGAERGALENELLRIQIQSARMRLSQMSAPAMPSPGQRWIVPGQIVDTTRLHQGITDNIDLAREKSSVPGISYLKMPDGSYMPVKSEAASQRLEDDVLGNLKHFVQRELGPSLWEKDPGRPARPGMRWTVNFMGNWIEVPVKKWNAPRMNWLRSRGGLSTKR